MTDIDLQDSVSLFSDDLLLVPTVDVGSLDKTSLINFVDGYEAFYNTEIFQPDLRTSDFIVTHGNTEVLLEAQTPTFSFFSQTSNTVTTQDGMHSIIHDGGSLKIEQNGGQVELLYDLNKDSELDIQVNTGSVKIFLDFDPVDGEATLQDGLLFIGELSTEISITDTDAHNSSISILNLRDGTASVITDNFDDSLQKTASAQPENTPESIDTETVSQDVLFTGDEIFGSQSELSTYEFEPTPSGPNITSSLSQQLNNADYFYEELGQSMDEYLDIDGGIKPTEISTAIDNSAQTEIDISEIIEIGDYGDLAWTSAIEIFEEI